MNQTKLIAWALVIITAGSGLLTFILLQQTSRASSILDLFPMIQAVMITVGLAGAVALFLWGLKGFKRELRIAYGLICAGLLILGLAQLQVPLVIYLDLRSSFWITSGLVVLPFIVPIILIFTGMRRFAKLLDIHLPWVATWRILGVTAILTIIFGLVGGFTGKVNSPESIINVVLTTWSTTFLAASAVIALQLKRTASVLYRDALAWFAASFIAFASAGLFYTLILVFNGPQSTFTDAGGTLLPHLIASFMCIRAGYAFKRINQEDRVTKVHSVSLIDILDFVAMQASNPSSIDTKLDTLRLVTAQLTPGNSLTPQQVHALQQTYAAIETYLVDEEPLRQFSRQQVHQKITEHFDINESQLVAIIKPVMQEKPAA